MFLPHRTWQPHARQHARPRGMCVPSMVHDSLIAGHRAVTVGTVLELQRVRLCGCSVGHLGRHGISPPCCLVSDPTSLLQSPTRLSDSSRVKQQRLHWLDIDTPASYLRRTQLLPYRPSPHGQAVCNPDSFSDVMRRGGESGSLPHLLSSRDCVVGHGNLDSFSGVMRRGGESGSLPHLPGSHNCVVGHVFPVTQLDGPLDLLNRATHAPLRYGHPPRLTQCRGTTWHTECSVTAAGRCRHGSVCSAVSLAAATCACGLGVRPTDSSTVASIHLPA